MPFSEVEQEALEKVNVGATELSNVLRFKYLDAFK